VAKFQNKELAKLWNNDHKFYGPVKAWPTVTVREGGGLTRVANNTGVTVYCNRHYKVLSTVRLFAITFLGFKITHSQYQLSSKSFQPFSILQKERRDESANFQWQIITLCSRMKKKEVKFKRSVLNLVTNSYKAFLFSVNRPRRAIARP